MFDPQFTLPSGLLRHLIAEETFQSRVGSQVNDLRGDSQSWYSQEVAASGVDAAELKLADWIDARNCFADAVSAAATGLLALAALDDSRPEPDASDRRKPEPPYVRLVSITRDLQLPAAHRHEGGVLILGTNPSVPGCSQPEGSMVFGRGGEIGLQSIGIAVKDLSKPTLLLFLPHPDYRSAPVEKMRLGYAVIGIDTDGFAAGMAMDYRFAADPVDFGLGLVDPENVVSGSSMSSGINAALKFPGSSEYLAKHLPGLGHYLEDAVAKLSGQHNH